MWQAYEISAARVERDDVVHGRYVAPCDFRRDERPQDIGEPKPSPLVGEGWERGRERSEASALFALAAIEAARSIPLSPALSHKGRGG